MLGTMGTMAGRWRSLPSYALRLPRAVWLFDCGEGTQRQIASCRNVSLGSVERVFVTHLHGDHVFGLPGLLHSLTANFVLPAVKAAPGRLSRDLVPRTYHVYGPVGIGAFVLGAFRGSAVGSLDAARLPPARVHVHELVRRGERPSVPADSRSRMVTTHEVRPDADGVFRVFEDGQIEVTAALITHTVPTLGYVVRETDRVGSVDMDKCIARGLKASPLIGKLKGGSPVTLPDGSTLYPEEVLGPMTPGRKVVILGDTCDPRNIGPIAEDADLLVHESTYIDSSAAAARSVGHSTSGMAGGFASDVRARTLILTHFSNAEVGRYQDSVLEAFASDLPLDCPNSTMVTAELVYPDLQEPSPLLRRAVGNARSAGGGKGLESIVAARDFMTFPVQLRRQGAK